MDVNTTNTTAKKRILALALALILLLLALTRVTLSYFTDTKKATNTFTYGNVSVTQWETKSTEDDGWTKEGITYTNFLPIGTTSPIINDIRHASNYNTKRVKVQNDTNSNPVYVRVFVRLRKELDKVPSTSYKLVHLDFYGVQGWGDQTYYTSAENQTEYAVYMYTYAQKLDAGQSTAELLRGVYLDQHADIQDQELVYMDGNIPRSSGIDAYNSSGNPQSIDIEVATQAVQADGFDDAQAAFAATFGSNDPWGGSITTTTPNP